MIYDLYLYSCSNSFSYSYSYQYWFRHDFRCFHKIEQFSLNTYSNIFIQQLRLKGGSIARRAPTPKSAEPHGATLQATVDWAPRLRGYHRKWKVGDQPLFWLGFAYVYGCLCWFPTNFKRVFLWSDEKAAGGFTIGLVGHWGVVASWCRWICSSPVCWSGWHLFSL